MVKENVTEKDSLVVAVSEEIGDLDQFVKITEESRRERQRRIDAGDETARLKIGVAPEPRAVRTPPPAAGGDFRKPPLASSMKGGAAFKGAGKFGTPGAIFKGGAPMGMKGSMMKGGFAKGMGKF